VHRNVANIVHTGDLNLLSVLEFAVNVLKVEHVIVCGHYGCGGVRAALHGNTGGLVGHWVAPVVDLARRNRARLDHIATEGRRIDALCEMNVEMQVARVAATPIMRAAWEAGQKVSVHGWIYGLRDGLLRDLGVTRGGLEEPPAEAGPGVDEAGAAEGRLGANGRGNRVLSALRLLGDAGDASAGTDEQEA
jgi:carbonic anhydrase